MDFFYPHQCVITRTTGETTEFGAEIFSPVYSGSSCYQPSKTTYNPSGVSVVTQPKLMISDFEAKININDRVEVLIENNIVVTGFVDSYYIVTELGLEGITLNLKQAHNERR